MKQLSPPAYTMKVIKLKYNTLKAKANTYTDTHITGYRFISYVCVNDSKV